MEILVLENRSKVNPRKSTPMRKSANVIPSKKKRGDPSKLAIEYSKFYEGKMQYLPKVPVTSLDDFSIWYTPGVAAVSLEVAKNVDLSFEYTNRWNMLCIL